jgi:glycosyltransferase involved in cell wall biosynthesis
MPIPARLDFLDYPFMPKKPLVSVLTPTYNRRPFIPQYLKNLRKQTYPHSRIEILVADDGEDLVRDLITADDRVRYLRLEGRRPLGWKRNLLAQEARGDILLHMDDDDYYPPMRISHAVARLMESDRLIAGASEGYIYNSAIDKVVVSGPFGPNHGLDGTFAYRRELLRTQSFDPDAMVRVEARFTANFTIPMVQLDPRSTILIMQHAFNTWDKSKTGVRPTQLRLKDFVKNLDDRRFYRTGLPKRDSSR